MKFRFLPVALISVVLLQPIASRTATADSWLMTGHDAQGTNANPAERVLGPRTVGSLHLAWSRAQTGVAIATDRNVFAVLVGGAGVGVLKAGDGTIVRRFTASMLGLQQNEYVSVLAYSRGRLLIGTNLQVDAVNPVSGKVIWRSAGGATFMVTNAGIAYTGKGCQDFCGPVLSTAINVATGKVLWRHPGNFGGVPMLDRGLLFQSWGESKGNTRVYATSSGKLVGTLPLFGQWVGDRNGQYIQVMGSRSTPTWLAKIGPNGHPLWKTTVGLTVSCPPALAGGVLYASSNRFHPGVVAINDRTGKIVWGAGIGAVISIAVANGLVYAHLADAPTVVVLRSATGEVMRRIDVRAAGALSSGLFVANGTLYVPGSAALLALRSGT